MFWFCQYRWEKKRKVWMPLDDPIKLTLNPSRGKSATIIGGISEQWQRMEYIVAEKTNVKCVREWIRHIGPKLKGSGAVLVVDGYQAHVSLRTAVAAKMFNIDILVVPPTCCK
jgi:hypothetical protein